MQKKIRKNKVFYHSASKVWEALSSQGHLTHWFLDGNFQPLEGASFEFLDKPGEKWKGVYSGEIISYQPQLNIAYSWCHRKLKHTTYVWWRVEAHNEKTTIYLEHSGFKGLSDYLSGFVYARFWNRKLKELGKYLHTVVEVPHRTNTQS